MNTADDTSETEGRDLNPKLEQLPHRIKFARGLYNWTQSDLAERSGVEQPSISRYERGHRIVSVSADTLIRLSDALRVSLVWLATGEGPVFGQGGPTITMTEPGHITTDRKRKPKGK